MASVYFGKLCIPFSSLEADVSNFEFRTIHPDLRGGESCHFPGEIRVGVKITRLGNDYLAELKVESKAACVCDRCGIEYPLQIQGEIKTLFTPDVQRVSESENDDIRAIPSGAQDLDISQDALDALILAVPTKCVCKETCKGLCALCGADLNQQPCTCTKDETDPRWDALKQLKMKT